MLDYLKIMHKPWKDIIFLPLQDNESVLTDDGGKANVLNDYFQNQTVINDDNVELPVIATYNLVSHLHDIAQVMGKCVLCHMRTKRCRSACSPAQSDQHLRSRY